MATKPKMKDALLLEQCRVAFKNAKSYPGIPEALNAYGYDSEYLARGEELLEETRQVYDQCKLQKVIQKDVYSDCHSKMESLTKYFLRHRKMARIVFRDKPKILDNLAILEYPPTKYVVLMAIIRRFYTISTKDKRILKELGSIKLTQDELETGLAMFKEVETALADRLKARADSKVSTVEKDKAMQSMRDWMSDFYSVAKIGLKDQPQLLAALRNKA